MRREREMTRLVGGMDEIKRTASDVAVGGSAIRTTGIGETAAGPSRSGVTGAVIGEAGAGGTL